MSTLRTYSLEELISPAPASESLPLRPQTPPLPPLRAPRGLPREGAAPARARGRAEPRPQRPAAGPTSSRAAGGSCARPSPPQPRGRAPAPLPAAVPVSHALRTKLFCCQVGALRPDPELHRGWRWGLAGRAGAESWRTAVLE